MEPSSKMYLVWFGYHLDMAAEDFPYGRQQFVMNLLLFIMLLVVLPLVLLSIQGADLLVVSALMGVVVILVLVFSVSPLLTAHHLHKEKIVLRQGAYFKAEIPMSLVQAVRRVDSGPRRTGTWFRVFDSVLYVTTRRYDLIEIQLKEERRFGWALGKKASRVVFDTTDNGRFLRRMEELGITPSSPILRS